ncbi:hypothetical protein WA026_014911 [Henosepilachna vigintioctopunctata]|uniref:Peptidase M13 N-terminal domain-containing protein n=1 Tax=Henosepilachna vigintioctopunctata TaxID=420089 RepID=A0AAW1UYA2_9CUCU
MTKFSYDLVSLYYRGRSPLKKEDNSFFMCLYTMLVILFILVCCLVLSILLRFGKVEEHHVVKHTEAYRVQNYSQTNVETTIKSTKLPQYEEPIEKRNLEPISKYPDWIKSLIDFFTGEEESNESTAANTGLLSSVMKMKNNDNNDFLSSSSASENTESLKQIEKNQNYGQNSFEKLLMTEIPETSSKKQFRNDDKLYNNYLESLASTQNVELITQTRQDTNGNQLFDSSETSTSKTSEEPSLKPLQNTDDLNNDYYLFGTSEHHLNLNRESEEGDHSLQNDTFIFKNAGTCSTSNCLMTASRMISSMNMLVKPCNDFYSFACGGSPVDNSKEFDDLVPNSHNDQNETSFLKSFHAFYESCSHHEHQFDYITRIQQAKNLLKDLDLLQLNQENSRTDLTHALSLLILFDVLPLFEVSVDAIPDISTYSISFTPPDKTSLSVEEWSPLVEIQRNCLEKTQETIEGSPVNITYMYNIYQICKNNLSEYMRSFETPIKELGNFGNMTDEEKNQYSQHITDFLHTKIFSITNEIPVVDQLMCVVEKQYEIVKMEELQAEFPEIDWKRLLNLLSSVEIHNQTSILICNKSYFKTVFRQIRNLDSKDVFDALSAILAHKLFHINISPTVRNSIMHFCNQRTFKLMPNIANYLQKTSLSSHDMNQMNRDLENIFENIKQQFDNFLQNFQDLDEDTISNIKEKLAEIQLKTFSIEDAYNERIFLEKLYKNLTLQKNNYVYNYFYATILRKQSIFSMHDQSITAENTFRNIIGRNEQKPVYFHGNNFIFLSYAFMKKVSVDLPWYIKLAKVGFPLAKTLVHLLEPLKSQNNETYKNIHLLNFMRNIYKDLDPLENSLNFGDQKIIFSLNDDLSRRERIAETIALRVLSHSIDNVQNYPLLPWMSYEYSREKIFFVALVQELCQKMPLMSFMLNAHESPILPSLLGTEMMLRNCETFSTLFGCRPQEQEFSDET